MKLNVKKTVNRTVLVDNSTDTDRSFDLSARVTVEGGRITNVADGVVRSDEADEANFYGNGDYLTTSFQRKGRRTLIFEAVESFLADIEENAEDL